MIQTERLILRELTADDFDALYEILSDKQTMTHYPAPFSAEKVRHWIDWNLENYAKYGFGLWAVVLKESGKLIGDCGITLQSIDNELLPEIGYHLHRDYQRKGFGKEAARAARDWFFRNTDYDIVYSYMKYTNIGSYSTALANGMEKIKEYADPQNIISCVYAITRSRWEQLTASNTVLDILLSRRSYRGVYTSQKVPRQDLHLIMEAGLAAPSGCNRQTTSLIGVDDPILVEKIKAVIDQAVASTAPAFICVLTQRIFAYRDKCFAVQDYSAAIENMLQAIHALGYASCWYEGHITDEDCICDRIASLLNVPEEYDLVCLLPVGVPVETAKAPKKKCFSERAQFNGFPLSSEIIFQPLSADNFHEASLDSFVRHQVITEC